MSKTITIELTEEVAAAIERARVTTGEDLSGFIARAAEERASVLSENRFLARRTRSFDLDGFLAVLNREGGAPPDADDEIPEGYVRPV